MTPFCFISRNSSFWQVNRQRIDRTNAC